MSVGKKGRLRQFAALADIVSTIIILLGIVIAISTYFFETNRERRVYTFEMSERYFSGELLTSRENLQAVYLSALRYLPRDFRSQQNAGSLIRARYAAETIDARALERNLFNVLEFFNVALSCVEQGLCRRVQFYELTQREAEEIFCVFRDSIAEIEARYSLDDIDRGLVSFSGGSNCSGD